MFCDDLDEAVIKQEVDDADIEDAVVIIPTLADAMMHIIFGKESPVSAKGLSSVIAFSSVPRA